MEQELQSRVSAGRIVLASVLLAVAIPVVWVTLSTLWHVRQPVYRLGPVRVGVVVAVCVVILSALVVLWRRAHPLLSAGVLVVSCLWALSLISFIGMLTLPISALLTLLLLAASRRAGGGAGGAVPPAVAIALSLAVLLFASPWIAMVQCGDGSVSVSGRPFDGNSGSGSGSSSGSDVGTAGHGGPTGMTAPGVVSQGGASYAYRCEGEKLVEFRRID